MTASTMAIIVWKPMFSRTYSSVTPSAFQNSGSLPIRTKLSKPIHFGVPRMLYWVMLK